MHCSGYKAYNKFRSLIRGDITPSDGRHNDMSGVLKKILFMGTTTFEAHLLEIQRNLLNFAYTLTMNRDDAYDLLQDTTLKALDSRDKYVENVNFKGWVFTIMRNLFINKYRRTMRSVVVLDQSEDLYQLNMSQDSGRDTRRVAQCSANPRYSAGFRAGIPRAIHALPSRLPLCRDSGAYETSAGYGEESYPSGTQAPATESGRHAL